MNQRPQSLSMPHLGTIAEEWDLVGPLRHRLISEGLDTSFQHILLPAMKAFLGNLHPQLLLDAGCGTGDLTLEASHFASDVFAIDVSRQSIDIAQAKNSAPNIGYRTMSIEGTGQAYPSRFDAVICNMVLMDTPRLFDVLKGLRLALCKGAKGCFTIFHPSFWFDANQHHFPERMYCDEFFVRMKFETRLAPESSAICTHFHRPFQRYFEEFFTCGFTVLEINELCVPYEHRKLYGAEANKARFASFIVQATH